MKTATKKVKLSDGTYGRKNRDMRVLLNYNILNLLERAKRTGKYDFPIIKCDLEVFPDYLALYNQPGDYHLTDNTAVCFYLFDNDFDGENGLFWAIYYNNDDRLRYFKERFKDVKYIVGPDYSTFGDIHYMENLYRLWKAHIVLLWFIFELKVVVIPSISYWDEESFPISISGYEECSVIAISAKGHVRYARERRLFKLLIRFLVDTLPLRIIIVYSACGNDENCLKLFEYAINKGVQIVIPQNSLRERNMQRRCQK